MIPDNPPRIPMQWANPFVDRPLFKVGRSATGRFDSLSTFARSERRVMGTLCVPTRRGALQVQLRGQNKEPFALQTFGGVAVVVHAVSPSHARWRACSYGRRFAA